MIIIDYALKTAYYINKQQVFRKIHKRNNVAHATKEEVQGIIDLALWDGWLARSGRATYDKGTDL
jgi:hypothetical protein